MFPNGVMTRDKAIDILGTQCSASTYPTLTEEQLGDLIDQSQRYSIWTAGTAYNVQDVVRPTAPNAHLYLCVRAGTSGPTEPIWALYTTADDRPGLTRPFWDSWGWLAAMPGSENSDGDVLWIEGGYDDGSGPYDVRMATYKAWLIKAGVASSDYDFTTDQNSFRRSQVIAQCREQAIYWAPQEIA